MMYPYQLGNSPNYFLLPTTLPQCVIFFSPATSFEAIVNISLSMSLYNYPLRSLQVTDHYNHDKKHLYACLVHGRSVPEQHIVIDMSTKMGRSICARQIITPEKCVRPQKVTVSCRIFFLHQHMSAGTHFTSQQLQHMQSATFDHDRAAKL